MAKLTLWFILFLVFSNGILFAQTINAPEQALTGAGGQIYLHDSLSFYDFAAKADGYWLFEPLMPRPKSAPLILFLHGYGGYNPMIYGKWIKHLVAKGNIVLFPRYQEHLLHPLPNEFSTYVAKALKDYLEKVESGGFIQPVTDNLAIVGHSFGGAIAADLAINFETHQIPRPKNLLLCSPGTGWISMGQLTSYEQMPADVNLLITVSEDDYVVGDELGWRIFQEATQTKSRNFIRQYRDRRGSPNINAYHNESYSLDKDFDAGLRGRTINRALRISALDAVDFYCYWKLFDALLECSRKGIGCDVCFGNTETQRFMGLWSDQTPVKELEVIVPEER